MNTPWRPRVCPEGRARLAGVGICKRHSNNTRARQGDLAELAVIRHSRSLGSAFETELSGPVEGKVVKRKVPLSPEIRAQVHKDVPWARQGRKLGEHHVAQWSFSLVRRRAPNVLIY